MGANISASRVQKAGRSIASVQRVCQTFEKQTASQVHTDRHPYPHFGKDFNTILKVLKDENVFNTVPGRHYPSFKFKLGLLQTFRRPEFVKRVEKSIKQLS